MSCVCAIFMMLGGVREEHLSLSGIYMGGIHHCQNLRTVKRCGVESVKDLIRETSGGCSEGF